MSLSNANVKRSQAGSIRTRLTLFYSLTTFILLTVTASFLYGTTVHILYHANHQFLSHEIDILKNLLEKKPQNKLALEQEVIEVPHIETGSVYHYHIRILDAKNNILLQTPNTNTVLAKAEFFNQTASLPEKESAWWNAPNGDRYLLMQATSPFGKTKNILTIKVALNVSYQQQIINKYRSILIVTLLGIMLVAIFLGYFIASRAMRSLFRLTETTKQITASSLHQRINPKSWPTELHSLGMAFNQMLDRIETSFAHLAQFSADLAHELRTPVNNLMGETEIVLSRKSSITDYRQVLESNLEELNRISHIIENLLFIARAENPKMEIKKELLHVGDEIKLVREFYEALADEKKITTSQEGEGIVLANPVMFRRMLSNVLSNSLKYTRENGWIKFSITQNDDDTLSITLTDNGIGIADEHLSKIFNRFYRVDSARSQSPGGSGLGLAIVKSIVDLHHGHISITSVPEKGTTVVMVFPK